MVQPLVAEPELDIVLGSRFLPGKNSKVPALKRHFILKPALLFQRLTTGLKLSDAHNGFRALSRRGAAKIRITHDNMAHASEIISEIARHKLRYQEVPITILYREFGGGFGSGLKILRSLLLRRLVK